MATIRVVSEIFASHGVCNTLFSDNGPQFYSEEFKSFSTEWKFKHVTSDPTYPQRDRKIWLPARILNIPNKERPRSYNIIFPTGRIWRSN